MTDPIEAKARECAKKLAVIEIQESYYRKFRVMAEPIAEMTKAFTPIIAAAMREAVEEATKELREQLDDARQSADYWTAQWNKQTAERDQLRAEVEKYKLLYEQEETMRRNANRNATKLRAALDVAEGALKETKAVIKERTAGHVVVYSDRLNALTPSIDQALDRIAEAEGGSAAQSS